MDPRLPRVHYTLSGKADFVNAFFQTSELAKNAEMSYGIVSDDPPSLSWLRPDFRLDL